MKDIQQKAAGNVDLGTEEWIEQYGRFVYGLAFRLTTDVQEAEDLSQETLLKAWLHCPELKNPAAVKSWLRTICVNEFRMKIRKQASTPLSFTDDMEALEQEGSLLTESIPSPVEEVIVSEEVERLRDGCFLAMAGTLPLNQRAACSRVDMFGLSIPETAEILDVTPKAVKGLLYRARLSLESFFRDHCGILDEKNPCRCSAWIEFSNNRNALQRETRTRITVLDYRGTGYQPNEETRRQILHYYRNIPDRVPSQEWYDTVASAIGTFFKNNAEKTGLS